jgi:hypothetical protein
MAEPVTVDLFVEDRAHEQFLKPLLYRIAGEEAVEVTVHVRSGRGGHGRAIHEFRLYQRLVKAGATDPAPELVVVGIDSNCTTVARKKAEIRGAVDDFPQNAVVAACPDPHIERWYLADPESFVQVAGHRPTLGKRKCARDHYKRVLADAVRQGGHTPTLGGIEFAEELVGAMNLYRAGQNDRSLRAFVNDLRRQLRLLKGNKRGGSLTPR